MRVPLPSSVLGDSGGCCVGGVSTRLPPESKSTALEVGVGGGKAELLSLILQFELSGGRLKNVSNFGICFSRDSFLSDFSCERFLYCAPQMCIRDRLYIYH